MEYNPYAAPEAGPSAPFRGMPGGSGPQPWDIGEVIGGAWEAFKPNWAVLVFSLFLSRLLPGLPGYAPSILLLTGTLHQDTAEYRIVYGSCLVASILISAFFQVGLIKIWLAAARDETPQFGDLFSGGPRYFAMVGCNLLTTLVIVVGFAALVVPGILLSLGLAFSAFFVVDQEMGPIEAMKASWAATDGQRGAIFLLSIVCVLLVLAGIMACCLGFLVTAPVAAVASTTVYLRISGRSTPAAGQGGAPGYGPPPAYGPPPGYGPPPPQY